MSSILDDIKEALNVEADDPAFDAEIIMHINSELATVNQIGIGPEEGLFITDATTDWSALLEGNARLNLVKSYIQLKVKLLFDGNNMTAHLLAAYEKQAEMFLWRAREYREGVAWVPPTVPASSTE